MKCPACKAPLKENARYCNVCGSPTNPTVTKENGEKMNTQAKGAIEKKQSATKTLKPVALIVLCLVLALAFVGCGSQKTTQQQRPATVAAYFKQNPKQLQQLQQNVDKQAKQVTTSTFGIISAKGGVKVVDNQIAITITTSLNLGGLAGDDAADIFNLFGGGRLLGSLLSSSDSNASTAQTIKSLEKQLGINGITIRYAITDSQGREISIQQWNDKGLMQ